MNYRHWMRCVVVSRGSWKWRCLASGLVVCGISSTQAATYHVATNGSDSNPGSLSLPFRNVQKAAGIMVAGDVCYIRGGVYRETVTPANSGNSGALIRFENYNGENVTISGADVVSGWTLYQGAKYYARMGWDLGQGNNQVFVDGQMLHEARWPNSSLDVSRPAKASADWAANASGSSNVGALSDSDLNQFSSGFWNGALIHILMGSEQLVSQSGMITWFSPGSLNFSYNPSGFQPRGGNPYFLVGKLGALDAPGEWFRDPGNGNLYLWTPAGDNPGNHLVEAKRRRVAMDLSNKTYISIKGISIFAATLQSNGYTRNCTIDGMTAKYVSHRMIIDACWGDYTGGSGIILDGSYNVLQNSIISFSSGNGVKLSGNNNKIHNCMIHDANYHATDCAPVWTTGFGHVISDSTLYNSGRCLLVHRGLKSSKIVRNELYNAGIQTFDLGATYTWHDDGQGTEFAYNWIHDVPRPQHNIGAGIYLDSQCRNYVIHHNVIWNVGQALKLNSPHDNSLVYNNTLLATQNSVESWPDNGTMYGCKFKNNIYRAYAEIFYGAESANNLPSSVNPMFVSSTSYQLQSGSPAINAGQGISPYTDGYYGSGPDMGAFEYGLATWQPGVLWKRSGGTAPAPAPAPAPSPSPTPTTDWKSQDIGSVSVAGSGSISGSTFTVKGAGGDIWGGADSFQFYHKPLNGNGTIVARLASLQNTDGWAKAGVMIRETLTNNSKHAMMVVTPVNGAAFQRRVNLGDATHHTASSGAAPLWLKLVRNGTTLQAYTSTSGSTWTLVGSASISMGTSVYAGLAITSHNPSVLCTATFDNVSVTTP